MHRSLTLSTDIMLYLIPSCKIKSFVVTSIPGIFLNLKRDVASENATIFAHILFPCRSSLYALMLARTVSFLLEKPSESVTFSAEIISIKLFIFPNDIVVTTSISFVFAKRKKLIHFGAPPLPKKSRSYRLTIPLTHRYYADLLATNFPGTPYRSLRLRYQMYSLQFTVYNCGLPLRGTKFNAGKAGHFHCTLCLVHCTLF